MLNEKSGMDSEELAKSFARYRYKAILKKTSAGKGKKYAEAVVAKYALLFEELVHKELY